MDDSAPQNADANTPKAPKDKNCPFCGQAFTSSSLGRHLDLYIKERNPKPADGVHDVDAIRKMRGNITRRQPRGSIGGRRDVSRTPTTTPRASISKRTPSHDDEGAKSSIPKDGQYVVDSQVAKFPFTSRWEATGVINDIPGKHGWDAEGSQEYPAKRPAPHRSASKQILQKTQFDAKQKLADAMDTARAAELALREFISSWRSAKQQIDNTSSPFDFDPLSYDFPALTLQCLKPPPTLFSSTQHPTSTSWSVQVPGKREFEALKSYFEKEFRAWKLTCATATTAVTEELVYPPNVAAPRRDVREAVKLAEQSTDNLEKQVSEHLQSAYAAWESLPAPRRNELWVLELARAVGRKQKDSDSLKHEQHRLKQENTNLKAQIDQLNILQQPREFKLLPPQTFPIDRDLLAVAFERGVKANQTVGFDIEDRHEDLSSLISKVIGRWKDVITSTRASSSGMATQKPLDQTAESPSTPTLKSTEQRITTAATKSTRSRQPAAAPATVQPDLQMHPSQASEASQASQASQEDQAESAAALTEENSEPAGTSTSDTAPPSVADTSDQDADAEMDDDDSFAIMNTSTMKTAHIAMQPQAQLDIPRTRGQVQQHQHQQQQQQQQQHQQQHQQTADMHYMMQNGAGSPVGRQGVTMTRSMPNMNMALQGSTLQDMGMSMQDVRGDPMYME